MDQIDQVRTNGPSRPNWNNGPKYTKVVWNWTEMDQSKSKRTKVDPNGPEWTELDPSRLKWTEVNWIGPNLKARIGTNPRH